MDGWVCPLCSRRRGGLRPPRLPSTTAALPTDSAKLVSLCTLQIFEMPVTILALLICHPQIL